MSKSPPADLDTALANVRSLLDKRESLERELKLNEVAIREAWALVPTNVTPSEVRPQSYKSPAGKNRPYNPPNAIEALRARIERNVQRAAHGNPVVAALLKQVLYGNDD